MWSLKFLHLLFLREELWCGVVQWKCLLDSKSHTKSKESVPFQCYKPTPYYQPKHQMNFFTDDNPIRSKISIEVSNRDIQQIIRPSPMKTMPLYQSFCDANDRNRKGYITKEEKKPMLSRYQDLNQIPHKITKKNNIPSC